MMTNCKFFKDDVCENPDRVFATCFEENCEYFETDKPKTDNKIITKCKFFEDGLCGRSTVICSECYGEENCDFFEIEKPETDCLTEASTIINGERQDAYGAPENSFELIAKYWSAYLDQMDGGPLGSVDVGNLLILFKMARCSGQKPSRDTYVDIAGYAAIVADRLMEDK